MTKLGLYISILLFSSTFVAPITADGAQNGEAKAFLPSYKMLERPFCKADQSLFANPPSVFYPEIWVECLNGNLSKEGILADLEAIHEAGFSGVQMFFGNQGGAWPGVKQISCLSSEWEPYVRVYQEHHRVIQR